MTHELLIQLIWITIAGVNGGLLRYPRVLLPISMLLGVLMLAAMKWTAYPMYERYPIRYTAIALLVPPMSSLLAIGVVRLLTPSRGRKSGE
jgi:hypothetical protein